MSRHGMAMALLLLAGCTVQSSNGNPVRMEQPFVLSDQDWHVTQQGTAPSGDRVCTIAAGELTITQRSHHGAVAVQVASANTLNPGDSYKVLAGDHVYETPQEWFDARQSEAIVQDITDHPIIYTEKRELTLLGEHGANYRSIDNKIPRDGFVAEYQVCTRYVQ